MCSIDHQTPETQILSVIHRKPASLDEITRRVRFTRHPSRVRLTLEALERKGRVTWTPNGLWRTRDPASEPALETEGRCG